MQIFFTLSRLILLFLAPVAVNAQGYEPLAPLASNSNITSLGGYLSDLFLIGIGLAGVLAVIMLIIAGVQYIGGASSESARKDAKDRIWAAILGLLIALGAWIILTTIDSNLVAVPDTNLQPTQIDTASLGSGGGTGGGGTTQYCFTSEPTLGPGSTQQTCLSTATACQQAEQQIVNAGSSSVTQSCAAN